VRGMRLPMTNGPDHRPTFNATRVRGMRHEADQLYRQVVHILQT